MNRASSLPLGVLIWMGCLGFANGQEPASRTDLSRYSKIPLPVNVDSLQPFVREALANVMQSPTITAVSAADEFCSSGDMYLWLLDHPDRVSLAWRRWKIGAIDITPQEGGRFVWKDDQGSELTWRTVSKNGDGRIWYAEGKVRPAALFPIVPIKAVAILRHGVRKREEGDPIIRHQVEVFLQTDSKAASIVLKMIGPTAPRMAEQGAEQMLLFFSGIAKYVEKNPSKAPSLLAERK
jgi:hypothetical protein